VTALAVPGSVRARAVDLPEPDLPAPHRLRAVAAAFGALVAAVGLVQLYGWVSHTRSLIQLRPRQVPMQFNTALCLTLLGLALLLLATRRPRAAAAPAAFTAVWGLVTLAEYLLGRGLGIDQLLYRSWIVTGVDTPGRMARNTAVCFAVLGVTAVHLALRRTGRAALLVGLASSLVAGLALVALFGYASGVSTAYTWRTSTAMAPLTAVALLAAAGGYLAAAWDLAPGGTPRWLPVPVAVAALATTLFLWQALVNVGAEADRTLSVDRASGVVLAIGVVLSALLAGAAWLGQTAIRRRRTAEVLATRLEAEAAHRAEVQDTLLRRTQRDSVLRGAYEAVSSETELATAFQRFAAAAGAALPFDRASLSVVGDTEVTVVAVAGHAAATAPVGTATPLTDPVVSRVLASRRAVLIRAGDAAFGGSFAARIGVRSAISVPVVIGGAVRATLGFSSTRLDAFEAADLGLADELASVVGGAIYTLARLDDERSTSARLRELDELKNEFVGVVAHDLRSPMTVIAGYLDTVLGRWDALPDEMKRELLGVALRNTKRLSTLVEDVLQVARIESGDFPYEIRPFDLAALVRRTAEEMVSARPDRPIDVAIDGDLPEANADEDRQWRVLTNILSNAQKFSPEGTPVRVAVARRGAFLEVTVADRGPGIPADGVARLFGKFARLGNAPGGEKGTGLGLYICKALVEAQGGEIAAESVVGEGTTVRYTVPVAS
jgi:signal transduction histidine kinase